jgi:hypothetical protein
VFFLAWLAGLAVVGVALMPRRPFLFTLALAGMTLILVVVCYIKGEPLSDRSKKISDS